MYYTAKITEMTPETHTFIHVPRKDRRGSGVGIFFSNMFEKVRVNPTEVVETFE